jgi:hypothetical protein
MPAPNELQRLGQELLDEPAANVNHAATLLAALEADGNHEEVLVAIQALKLFFQDSCAKGDLPARRRKVSETLDPHPPSPPQVCRRSPSALMQPCRRLTLASTSRQRPSSNTWPGWRGSVRTFTEACSACSAARVQRLCR